MRKKFSFKLPSFNLTKRFNLNPKSMTYLMLGLFFLVGGFYFVLVNVVSNKGTELRMLEIDSRDLEAQNQRLEVEAARLKSLQVIDADASGQVEVGDNDKTTTDSDTTTNKTPVTFVPSAPKLVPSKHYTYLPSYTALAQR
ncbi:MAG: hypothetical protein WC553_01495 [Patescibacteria group bacterium]